MCTDYADDTIGGPSFDATRVKWCVSIRESELPLISTTNFELEHRKHQTIVTNFRPTHSSIYSGGKITITSEYITLETKSRGTTYDSHDYTIITLPQHHKLVMSDPTSTPSVANPALSALKADEAPKSTSGPSTAASSPAPVFNTQTYELNAKVSLADLCAKGTSHYAHKQYEDAAEYFARAAELQAEVNGEMSEENGEVLFLYGRSLFRLGQSNSDVLGGSGGNKEKKPAVKPKKEVKEERETVTEAGVAIMAEGVDKAEKEIKEDGEEHVVDAPKKPLFQFTGDENFEDSDDEDEDEAEGEEEEEEDDELGTAFEVLDLARVLFTRKLDTILSDTSNSNDDAESKDKGKGKSTETKPSGYETPAEAAEDTPLTRHIKERLADTHDLLAEISLENERFPNAVADFKESLKYKEKLYPFFSEIIAEAHYKLSLALEFASITTTQEAEAQAEAGDGRVEAQIDEAMREEAAKELEKAIESTEGKLKEKELEVAETNIVEENDVTRKQIVEVKEIIADMKQRVSSLTPKSFRAVRNTNSMNSSRTSAPHRLT